MGQAKKFMYINRHAPCGTAYAVEGLEVVLPCPERLDHFLKQLRFV